MEMHCWLWDGIRDGSLTREDLEEVMMDDNAACELWREYARDPYVFIHEVRGQVWPFILYLKKKDKDG